MISPESVPDVLVIGAGIAGLAAARVLTEAGARVRVFEARTRAGGRIDTVERSGTGPIERGAEFVHGGGSRVRHYLERFGIACTPVSEARGLRVADGERLRHPIRLLSRSTLRLVRAVSALVRHRGPDESVADFLRGRGLAPTDPAWRLARLQVNAACATLESLGVVDAATALRSSQSRGGNFRPVGGYGGLVEAMARGLDIRHDFPVSVVRRNDTGIEIESDTGETVRAPAAIVTLPLGVLKSDAVRFEPALPEPKRAAVAALSMQPAAKLACRFRHPAGPARLRTVIGDDEVPTFWRDPASPDVWTGFVTGPKASAVAAAPDPAVERLCVRLGTGARDALDGVDVVDWARDPWSRGGYSSAPAGAFPARAVLAEPLGALAFAGEASVSSGEAGTVSGAIESGERAAAEVLAIRRTDRVSRYRP